MACKRRGALRKEGDGIAQSYTAMEFFQRDKYRPGESAFVSSAVKKLSPINERYPS
jgi:hypothetical protein